MSEIQLSQNSYTLILGLCLLILFLPYSVWPQAIPIHLFQATLKIERTDTNNICDEGETSDSILLFGFDQPERIISLPQPSGFCLMASFDPNTTIADGRTFAQDHNDYNNDWMVTFLPSHPLRGTWGIKINYPEPHIKGDLMFTWRSKGSDGFPSGRFFIRRDFPNEKETKGINIKDASFAIMTDVANDEIVRVEYYHDSCLFDTNIPSKDDDYEPDDDPSQVEKIYNQEQIHTFHDPNDIDCIRFRALPERKYYISLLPVCPPPIDPDIIPFEVSLFIDGSPFTLPPLELKSSNPPVYGTTWENETNDSFLAYIEIKINPEIEYLGFLPYMFSLEKTNLNSTIINQKLKISAKKSKYIDHIYLKSNYSHEECSPSPDKYDPGDPNYLFYEFICNFSTVSNSFSLCLSDTVLDNSFDVRWDVDLDDYLPSPTPDSFPLPINDQDCDGIVGDEDPNPNRPNLLFRSGLNLYHHPFHPIYRGAPCKQIDLCTHFKPHMSDLDLEAHIFLKQADAPGMGWQYYLVDSDCTDDIPLSNKAGCLLYVSNQDLVLEDEKGIWGKCFSEMFDPDKPVLDPNDPNNLIIELAPGPNIIGFTYYEAFTFTENKDSEYRTFADKSVDSFALLQSINSPTTKKPTTSIESLVPSVDPNLSMDNPKAQVHLEQKIRSSVLRYDSRKGGWSYCTSFFGRPSGERFDIGIDEAYLVYFNIEDPNNNKQDPKGGKGKNWYPAIFFWP